MPPIFCRSTVAFVIYNSGKKPTKENSLAIKELYGERFAATSRTISFQCPGRRGILGPDCACPTAVLAGRACRVGESTHFVVLPRMGFVLRPAYLWIDVLRRRHVFAFKLAFCRACFAVILLGVSFLLSENSLRPLCAMLYRPCFIQVMWCLLCFKQPQVESIALID